MYLNPNKFLFICINYMSKQTQLNQLLIPRGGADDGSVVTVDVNWLKDLFQPDSIKDGQSLKSLEKIGGYQGLQNRLKTSLNKGIPNSPSDNEWRAKKFGTNDPIVKPPRTLMDMILSTFQDQTMKILCAAAILSLALGIFMHGLKQGWLEGASILLAVVIISGVTACNDYMKQKQFRKLNEVANRKNINVIRNGQTLNMSVYDILVGDIALIQTGQILSVDGIVFKASKMSNDQSSITGESDLVKKQQFVSGKKKCNPFLISGSRVMEGTGYMIVLAVGRNSREGINKEKLQQDSDDTPLQEKLSHLADQIGRMGMLSAGLTFLALIIHLIIDTIKNDRCVFCLEQLNMVVSYFIIAVSIVVIAVPEGLPLAVTISLAYSVGKMKDQNNLVRFLSACQTMGGANNVCTDKTGTLTKNLMTVTKLWAQEKVLDVFDKSIKVSSKTIQMIGKGICINSNAHPKVQHNKWQQIGNKTQCALLQMVYKLGYDFSSIRKQIKILETVPFSSDRKRMSAICQIQPGKIVIFSKGAPDFLLPTCSYYVDKNGQTKPIEGSDFKEALFYNLNQFASRSLRTLLLCYRIIDKSQLSPGYHPEQLQKNLIVLGMAGIKDPLKEGISQAVNSCKRAGIVVRMVTGDITQTAIAIAKDANILPANFQKPEEGRPGQFSVMEGKKFRQRVEGLVKAADADKEYVKNMKQFTKIVKQLRVLARSSPQDKYLLATGLKQMGHVVAMTGDGTNDAPALKKADIGFAMGIAGTEVAKQAAGIILLDDNFGSIITAIKYGRNIFDCIRKFLQFQLTVNVVAIFMAFLGAVFIKESPLTPVQMLWVNLIMDTLAALALATQPPSNQLLFRMPYSRTQRIITAQMWRFIIVSAIFQIVVLIIILFKGPQLFGVQSSIGLEKEHWNNQTGKHLSIFFDVFVFLQVFNFFNARKLGKDEINIFSEIGNNYLFMIIVVGIFFCQLFIVQFGGKALMLVPLSFKQHFICILIGCLSLVNGFILKKFIPEGVFSCVPLLNENQIVHAYDVDGELKKIWLQPATHRRSSKQRI